MCVASRLLLFRFVFRSPVFEFLRVVIALVQLVIFFTFTFFVVLLVLLVASAVLSVVAVVVVVVVVVVVIIRKVCAVALHNRLVVFCFPLFVEVAQGVFGFGAAGDFDTTLGANAFVVENVLVHIYAHITLTLFVPTLYIALLY